MACNRVPVAASSMEAPPPAPGKRAGARRRPRRRRVRRPWRQVMLRDRRRSWSSPYLLAVEDVVAEQQPGPRRDLLGRHVTRMDVRGDVLDAAALEPVDEGDGRFSCDSLSLPCDAHDPCDLGMGSRYGRLHGPGSGVAGAKADDPVEPGLPAVRRVPNSQAPIAKSKLSPGRWVPARELVQALISKHVDHLICIVWTK